MNARLALVVAVASAFAAVGSASPRGPANAAAKPRTLPYYTDKSLTPRWPADAREAIGLHRVGNFHLTASDGREVTGAEVAGHVYVASFFYTECRTLCPDLKAQLTRVHEAFAGDTSVMIVSHSVMPERDNPARLAHYAVRNGIDGRQWRLVTGDRAEVTRLARDAYFVELADTTGNTRGRLRHTETLVLVDGQGHIRGVYDGSLAYDVTSLIADIRHLKQS
jgi:protein SCO1/2